MMKALEFNLRSKRTPIMKRILTLTLLAALLATTACHTIQGAGQDVTAVGKGMESATK